MNLTMSSLTLLKSYSLYLIVRLNTVYIINPVKIFAVLLVIMLTGIVNWTSFLYIEY